jgi:hypothetical protein
MDAGLIEPDRRSPPEAAMSTIRISANADIAAPADRVYRILSNYREHHPRILPPAFSDFTVEEGGIGAGTVMHFRMTTAGRTQSARHRVEEPVPGRVLRELDLDRDMQTTFTMTPNGAGTNVAIDTVWNQGGPAGLAMRLLAPRLLRPIYADELDRLERYAREHPEI